MYLHGIGFALLALVCWAFGDFFIQKTSREYGIWTSLACIVFFATIVLFPFVFNDLVLVTHIIQIPLLIIVPIIELIVVLLQFKAFQIGKMVVIEPIMSFELPLTVLLGVFILQESLTGVQMILIAIAFLGIFLTSSRNILRSKISWEQGVVLAIAAVIVMSGVNLTRGLVSQEVGAIFATWFVSAMLSLACSIYFSVTGSWKSFFAHIKKYPRESFLVAVFDNGAWLAYSAAVILIPISLAITVSEGYIALAMMLGVIFNKEKLSRMQWIGAITTFVAVVVLAAVSG